MRVKKIMLLAAGLGGRMLDLTNKKPKTLIELHGKPMLFSILEFVSRYDFEQVIINLHHCPEQIKEMARNFQSICSHCPEITFIYESERLETGGGIKNAFQYFRDEEAIFTINSDSILLTRANVFEQLIKDWSPGKMDFLLLLISTENVIGSKGSGDFDIDENNRLSYNSKRPYLYTGIQILKPGLVKQNPQKIFSISEYYKEPNNVYARVVNDSVLLHSNTQEDIKEIESFLLGR